MEHALFRADSPDVTTRRHCRRTFVTVVVAFLLIGRRQLTSGFIAGRSARDADSRSIVDKNVVAGDRFRRPVDSELHSLPISGRLLSSMIATGAVDDDDFKDEDELIVNGLPYKNEDDWNDYQADDSSYKVGVPRLLGYKPAR